MNRIFIISAVCCLLLTSLLIRHILKSGEAKWLAVETPSYAAPGLNFKVKVLLKNSEPGRKLSVDLHRMNEHGESPRCISVSRPVEVTSEKTIYEFSLPIPHDIQASYIFPVIILSEDGTWNNRIKAAESEAVPVNLLPENSTPVILEQRKTRNTAEQALQIQPESGKLSFLISVLWLAVALTAFISRKSYSTAILFLTSIASAAWEALDSSTAIVNKLRHLAMQSGIYDIRREPQQILTIIIIVTAAVFLLYILHSMKNLFKAIPSICIAIFWSIALLRILSLHEIDRLLSMTVAGAQAGQIIRLGASIICLAAVIFTIKIQGKSEQHHGSNTVHTDI
jgi:hypothetical protein